MGLRADEDRQNSSWRPPGGAGEWDGCRRSPGEGREGRSRSPLGRSRLFLVLLLLAVSNHQASASPPQDMEGVPVQVNEGILPSDLASDATSRRQGRNLEEVQHELRPSIKKTGPGLTVRWARSTTLPPRVARQSPAANPPAKPIPEHFIQPAFLLPFGQRLTKESPLLRQASTQDVIKPSNIRKRNFSASLVQVVSQEDGWEGGIEHSNNIGGVERKTVPRELVIAGDKEKVVNKEIKGERTRGAIARDVSVTVPKKIESDWERSRISFRRPAKEPSSVKSVAESSTPRPRVNRGRIRLNRSKLGIFQIAQSTTRSPRQDDDEPQRPSKRDRIRNLKIRRPFKSAVNSSHPETTSPSPNPLSAFNNKANTVTTTATTPPAKSERTLSGRLEYKDIVRTTQEPTTTTRASTVVVRTKPTTTTRPERSSSVILPVSTTELFRATEATTTTQRSLSLKPEVTKVTKSTTFKFWNSTPDLVKSTLALLDSTTESFSESSVSSTVSSIEASSISSTLPSSVAAVSVTPADILETSEIKLLNNQILQTSVNQSDIGTPSPPLAPARPKEELKQDLLEAIRRKISRNKVSSFAGKKAKTNLEISISEQSDLNISEKPKSSSLRAVRLNTPSFSPSYNSVSSTRPPFFRPISFPPRKDRPELSPKVRIFVNIPEDGEGNGVKIPNISHIQDKLARLNAAITVGLKQDQQEKEREEAIRADWQRTEEKEEKELIERIEKKTGASLEEVLVDELRAEPSFEDNVTVLVPTPTMPAVTPEPTTSTSTTTTTTISSTTTTVTTTHAPTPAMTRKPSTKKPREWRKKKPLFEHPSSHFRPDNSTDQNDFLPMPKSNLPSKEDVFIVTPKYGMYTPIADRKKNVTVSNNQTARANVGRELPTVLEDITGTTVYVIGIIAIIPAVGLMAWLVRLAVRRKGLRGSESSSETGLNRPITEDDSLQITGRSGFSLPSHSFDTIQEAPENIPKSVDSPDMLGSVWEFPRNRLRLQTVLGEGNFGKVWKAEVDDICGYEGTILVAVKGVKENSAQREKDDLVQEMKIMQEIGPHPNVVTILGVCTQQEPQLLIMEYVMYGKLLTHLREQRMRQSSFFNFSKDGGEVGETLTSKDLNKFAYGVAKGMEFLVSKGVIHRDLAARNILVDHNKNTKISDFGLSRNLRDLGGEMYEQKTKGALPIRWMAPESLYFSVFTPKSDVWGFGILMWEIVTLGSTPYPGMGAREVMRRVRDGYRLERPAHCHPDLYLIIQKCWAGDMNKRPDFSELRKEIAKLLEDQHGYIDLQNIPENKYYSMDQNPDEEEKL